MTQYRPRRASLKRWLKDAPEYILDVLDNKGTSVDRYTVMFCGSQLISDGTRKGTYIFYLAMSDAPTHPQGFSQWGELEPYQAASFRYKSSHHRIKWLDLPLHIREHVMARVTE